MKCDWTISLTVRTLVDSACLSRSVFLLDTEVSLNSSEISGQPQAQHDDGKDECEHNNSSLRILNAVKLSLKLTRAFAQCWNDRNSNNDLGSLWLDDFIVKMRYSAIAGEEQGDKSRAGGEQLLIISSVDQLNAITSTDGNQWILVDMGMKYYDAGFPSESESDKGNEKLASATVMQSLGKLLYAIFSPNNAPLPDAQDSNEETLRYVSKTRRRASESLFQHLLEKCYPISICRLLSDLIDTDKRNHSIISFDDVIQDLEQMISIPHMFLYNPDGEFFSSTIHFGQKFYGRSKEIAKLLEITTCPNEGKDSLEIIFVSGMAGTGKSHFVSAVGSFVSRLGLGVFALTAKFERGMKYKSREIVTTLMDKMVSNFVQISESENNADVCYSHRVARAITSTLDADSLSALIDFVPSIQALIPEITKNENSSCTHRQLVFLLSKLLSSVLSQERKIFMALDNLQWADSTTLGLISEVLISVCQCPEERGRLVFVGMYRDNEVSSDLMLFIAGLVNLEGGGSGNVTDMKLSFLSRNDVTEMIMHKLRLPKRLVFELADVVHKRTHGHALFVVQLLNSLVSDSTISYSPMLHRFHWDQDQVCILNTSDNVAGLIVSNLASLPAEELECLRIMSCFGIQVQSDLLELLEVFKLAPQGGFKSCLCNLVDQGIIEIVSILVVFAHDLIQEQVYEGIPVKERRQLHCDIGIFLGSETSLDISCEHEPIDAAIDRIFLSDVVDNEDSYIDASSLLSIATSQINNAGPEFFSDRAQLTRFASWNLRAGKDAAEKSNFNAALYYYKNGIAFLGDECWLEDTNELCLRLHEGAAFSSSALGESSKIPMYTDDIFNNVHFDDSLVAECILIDSLFATEKYSAAVARGVAILRQLKFDIPATPNPVAVMQKMEKTEREASMYNFSQIAGYERRVDLKTRNILKLVEVIAGACYHMASPFLPFVACETVRYSLQNGVCQESASAFIIFAYFQIFFKQSFGAGRKWGNVGKNLLDQAAKCAVTTRSLFLLFGYVNFWYVPLQESINHMREIERMSMKFGDTTKAYLAQCLRYRFLFFRGEKLSILSHDINTNLQSMARFSEPSLKFSALDKEMIDSLTGDKSSNPYAAFDGIISSKESLLADAQSKRHFQTVEAVHLQEFFVSFWMGDYDEAAKASDIAMSFPSAKMPKMQLIYHTFYRGVVALYLYREGKGETWLKEGSEMQDQLKIWVKNSKPIFENKLILLEAEHYASMCNVVAAKESYELSIKVARDNGYTHEQGLAYECMGKYLMSIVEVHEAGHCFLRAHECYLQWGAMAKATKLWRDWKLDLCVGDIVTSKLKHQRDENNEGSKWQSAAL